MYIMCSPFNVVYVRWGMTKSAGVVWNPNCLRCVLPG